MGFDFIGFSEQLLEIIETNIISFVIILVAFICFIYGCYLVLFKLCRKVIHAIRIRKACKK